MKQQIHLLDIEKMKCHERTLPSRVSELVRAIQVTKTLNRPIIVDKRSSVVLDGHHRLEALRILGAKRIPAYIVDYQSPHIRVYLRRKQLAMQLIKDAVIRSAETGKKLPTKTTRHFIAGRPGICRISVRKLL